MDRYPGAPLCDLALPGELQDAFSQFPDGIPEERQQQFLTHIFNLAYNNSDDVLDHEERVSLACDEVQAIMRTWRDDEIARYVDEVCGPQAQNNLPVERETGRLYALLSRQSFN